MIEDERRAMPGEQCDICDGRRYLDRYDRRIGRKCWNCLGTGIMPTITPGASRATTRKED